MKLGAFSVSLAVKDLKASRVFYETLGFSDLGGVAEQNWLIMTNGSAVIGLFQGMFDRNILTFNPGWGQDAKPVDPFDDIRTIQAKLEAAGIAFELKADPATAGPAHFVIHDPDGNQILVDQHR
jgi:lactoylglutathione lyase